MCTRTPSHWSCTVSRGRLAPLGILGQRGSSRNASLSSHIHLYVQGDGTFGTVMTQAVHPLYFQVRLDGSPSGYKVIGCIREHGLAQRSPCVPRRPGRPAHSASHCRLYPPTVPSAVLEQSPAQNGLVHYGQRAEHLCSSTRPSGSGGLSCWGWQRMFILSGSNICLEGGHTALSTAVGMRLRGISLPALSALECEIHWCQAGGEGAGLMLNALLRPHSPPAGQCLTTSWFRETVSTPCRLRGHCPGLVENEDTNICLASLLHLPSDAHRVCLAFLSTWCWRGRREVP